MASAEKRAAARAAEEEASDAPPTPKPAKPDPVRDVRAFADKAADKVKQQLQKPKTLGNNVRDELTKITAHDEDALPTSGSPTHHPDTNV